MKKTTSELEKLLKSTAPEQFLSENQEELLQEERPFTSFMRQVFERRGVKQQELFMRIGFAQSLGYKLISGEKRTRQRDYILRICIGAQLSLPETQRALQLYRMNPLYARMPRDAVLISAIQTGRGSIEAVNELLESLQMPPLRAPGTE